MGKRHPLVLIIGVGLLIAGLVIGAQWLQKKNHDQVVKRPDISNNEARVVKKPIRCFEA